MRCSSSSSTRFSVFMIYLRLLLTPSLAAARLRLWTRAAGNFSPVTVAVAGPGSGRPADPVGSDALLELLDVQGDALHGILP
jgi:hypothetical protein